MRLEDGYDENATAAGGSPPSREHFIGRSSHSSNAAWNAVLAAGFDPRRAVGTDEIFSTVLDGF